MGRISSLPTVCLGMITTNKFGCIDITDDWEKWQRWLNTAKSFRYLPKKDEKAFTARKEQGSKGKASYWYGYRKQGGKLAKCYIGTEQDLTVSHLEASACRLTEKLQTLVKEKVTQKVPVTNDEVEKLQREVEELHKQLQIALGK
ncbi:MAG: hypothetical protein MET45_23840 [Nostoc sp. LLA-1]|nr:hypothetical protein [Cyanocohniella sp. LLY]